MARWLSVLRPLGWRSDVLVLSAAGMAAGHWLASSEGPGAQLASILLASLVGLVICVWIGQDARFNAVPISWLLTFAMGIRLLATQASPLLEDDHYRYLWDGFQTATTGSPYRWAPSYFFGGGLDGPLWSDVLGAINNPDIPTIYGPVLQGLFAFAYRMNPGQVGAIQAVLWAIELVTLGLLARAGTPMRWLLVYAIHPAVLKEAMASAHPDGLLGLLLLLAVLAWQGRRPLLLGLVLGLAVAAKVSALVTLPFFLLVAIDRTSAAGRITPLAWGATVAVAFGASLALCYLPFLWMGGADWRALAVFGQQWRFNPLLYRLLELLTPAGGTRAVAALCLLIALATLWWRWIRIDVHAPRAIPPVDTALLLLLLFSPVVNPWYWLWALPVAVYRQRPLIVGVAAVGALSYVNSTVISQIAGSVSPQSFSVPWAATWLQIGVIFFTVAYLQIKKSARTCK